MRIIRTKVFSSSHSQSIGTRYRSSNMVINLIWESTTNHSSICTIKDCKITTSRQTILAVTESRVVAMTDMDLANPSQTTTGSRERTRKSSRIGTLYTQDRDRKWMTRKTIRRFWKPSSCPSSSSSRRRKPGSRMPRSKAWQRQLTSRSSLRARLSPRKMIMMILTSGVASRNLRLVKTTIRILAGMILIVLTLEVNQRRKRLRPVTLSSVLMTRSRMNR